MLYAEDTKVNTNVINVIKHFSPSQIVFKTINCYGFVLRSPVGINIHTLPAIPA